MADYLSDDEQAERLKQWWDKNGTALVVGLAVSVAVVVGWRFYQDFAKDRADAASDAFADYLQVRTAEQPQTDHLAILDDEFAGTTYHVFSLLYRAADQAAEEDWEEALALLERAVELADDPLLRDTARYRAAKVLFQLDRADASEALLATVQSGGLQAQVAELSGDMALARGDTEAARLAYQAAVDAARGGPSRLAPGIELLELKLASLSDSSAASP